jgi:heterotetrameric sarcosine oxidase gamma subunit
MNTLDAAGTALDMTQIEIRSVDGYAHVLIVSAVDGAEAAAALNETCAITVPTEPGTVCDEASHPAFWLSPRSWLLRVERGGEAAVLAAIRKGFPDRRLHATRYSDALHWFELSGPDSAALLARGGFVTLSVDDLAVGRMKRTLIADVPVLIWRQAQADWSLAVERSRAGYMAEWFANARSQRLSPDD